MATLVNNQNNDQKQGQQNTPGQIAQPTAAASGPAFAGQQSGSSNTPASSGRFVNTQQYLNANKNAGQQIGGAIQSGINSNLEQEKSAVGKEADNVRAGIDAAKGNVSTGAGYLGNFGGDASKYNVAQPVQKLDTEGMVAMANDANKLKQVTDYRTGTIAQQDTSNLNNLNQTYADRAAAANAALQQRQQQLQGEANRFGLLNEFVGQKNNYGQGAQRLDQTFLQRDKSGALNNLQQNLKGQTDVFGKLIKQGDTFKGEATDVTGQEQALAKDIGTQTGAVESGYLTDLGSKVGDVNAQRDAQRQQYKDFLDIMKGTKQGQVADPVWSDFGLADNMNAYNTFNNIKDIGEIADISGDQAKDYHNIATQKNVDQYSALAKLAGLDNAKLNAAGNLTTAAKAKTDNNSLLSRIVENYNNMLDTAKGTNLTGAGTEEYYAGTDWLGRAKYGSSTDYSSTNMGDILKGAGIDVSQHITNPRLTNSESQAVSAPFNPTTGPQLLNPVNAANLGLDLAKDASSRTSAAADQTVKDNVSAYNNPKNLTPTQLLNTSNAGIGFTNNIGTQLGRDLGGTLRNVLGMGNGVAGAEGAAKTKSIEDLQRQITQWQQDQGLNNVATRSGVKNRNDSNFVNTMKMMNGGAV